MCLLCATSVSGDTDVIIIYRFYLSLHFELAPTPRIASPFSHKIHPPRDIPLHDWRSIIIVGSQACNQEAVGFCYGICFVFVNSSARVQHSRAPEDMFEKRVESN